jgi:hypothetical protein
VQQQYRPRSPVGAPTQGNASSYAPAGSDDVVVAEHVEPANQGANARGTCDFAIVSHMCVYRKNPFYTHL